MSPPQDLTRKKEFVSETDVEHISDQVMMMKDGRFIFQGKWSDKDESLEDFYLRQFEEDGVIE